MYAKHFEKPTFKGVKISIFPENLHELTLTIWLCRILLYLLFINECKVLTPGDP